LLLLSLILGLAGFGAWNFGLFDRFMTPSLPVASPYVLTASLGSDGIMSFSGNAPDRDAAELLRRAAGTATGKMPAEGALALADGVPSEDWVRNVIGGLEAVTGLQEWSLSVADTSVAVVGLASNRETAAERVQALNDWSSKSGFKSTISVSVGPKELSFAQVQDIIDPFATCGPLTQQKDAREVYVLGDTLVIAGAVEDAETAAKLQTALEDTVGDRKVRIDTTVLNDDLCTVRNVLPQVQSDTLSIWLGNGNDGQVNLSGIYHAGDNPVAEILVPSDLAGLSLWVVVVDNTGKVFNLVPNINVGEHEIQSVGAIEGGQRRVRVLYSLEQAAANDKLPAFKVNEGDFGKSEIIAFLSKTSLFGIRRPRDESVASFAEALETVVREEPGNILSIATRLLDSRP
jgi:eukaryotic-like serine/threonine-protein kinase